MNFNDSLFLIFFLPITLLAYYVSPPRWRLATVALSSLVFYLPAGELAVAVFAATIVHAWAFGLLIQRWPSRWIFWSGIALPLMILFLFKYLGFVLDSVGMSKGHPLVSFFVNAGLPAGVSFHTFQVVAYLIDVRRRTSTAEVHPIRFAAFTLFFPILIAGPITRYREISANLHAVSKPRPDHWRWAMTNLCDGLPFLVLGLFTKVFFADIPRSFQGLYDVATMPSTADSWFAVINYALIIYYDFFGYSLMALGLAAMLGIKVPLNFRSPYTSPSPREFWRRWHVTLSMWLRDYVYLPLGGNNAYVRNIAITFLACGLWHGAGTNFIAWGAYHAVLVIGYHWNRPWFDKLPHPLRVFITFILVAVGWPLFYLPLNHFGLMVSSLVGLHGAIGPAAFGLKHYGYTGAILMLTMASGRLVLSPESVPALHRFLRLPEFHAGLLVLALVFLSWSQTFIYFQF